MKNVYMQTGGLNRTNHKRMALLLGLTLFAASVFAPGAVLAVTEGAVEDAPGMELELSLPAPTPDPGNYLPDLSYYADAFGDQVPHGMYAPLPAWYEAETYVEPQEDENGFFIDLYQGPAIIGGESIREIALHKLYKEGLVTGDGESVLNATQNVTVGVYPVNPEDYDGVEAYLILPGTCLTDEQILSIIDAFDRLGLEFEPLRSDHRWIMRGGGVSATRYLTQEEGERKQVLNDLIRRGILNPEDVQLPECSVVTLAEPYFEGLSEFVFRPYRSMTDAELVAELIAQGVRAEGMNLDDIEGRAREVLCGELGQPLSMALNYVSTSGSYIPVVRDEMGYLDEEALEVQQARESYGAHFEYVKETGVRVNALAAFDKETGRFLEASVMDDNPIYAADPADDRIDESITAQMALDTAKAYAEDIGYSGLNWNMIDDVSTNWGTCFRAAAKLGDGEWLFICVGRDDGQVHGLIRNASEWFAK